MTFALSETRISLKRLKRALFGGGKPPPSPPAGGGVSGDGPAELAAGDNARPAASADDSPAATRPAHRRGHGRHGADAYTGATPVVCRHETLAAGQRCPAGGRGTLSALPAGVEIRIDGNALLSAVRYQLEKRRCSACGEVFTADLPAAAGADKHSPRARAVIALARYYLGLPFYRLERYQTLVGVPVADATQWDLAEGVADCAYPVFDYLWRLGAQGEVIFQDDTDVRILALVAANRRADAVGDTLKRRGMYTTGLVVQVAQRVICLYRSGRAHAGDNLTDLLTRRSAELAKPSVMSDALAANQRDDDNRVIRCHCLAHGRRQVTDLEEVFPAAARQVIRVLDQVFAHEAITRQQAMTPAERLAYHQTHSGPLLGSLHAWLEQQFQDRLVEPNSSLGKAFTYLLSRWQTLTQFLRVKGGALGQQHRRASAKRLAAHRRQAIDALAEIDRRHG